MPQEILQQFNMKVKILLCHCSLGNTYLLLTLLYMMLLLNPAHSRPVTVHRRQTPRLKEDLRTECHRSNSTCDFYSHCIDPMFPCGETGFVLDYAQKRCQRLSKFKHDPIMSWTHDSELCFQRKLYSIVKRVHNTTFPPSPSTCLRLEREAIEEMNRCYNNENRLCDTVLTAGSNDSEVLEHELQRVMEAVRVGGDYYESTVDRGIPAAVRQCGHTQLAESLQTQVVNQRLIICTFATFSSGVEQEDTPSFIQRLLSKAFEVPQNQFKYSRVDDGEMPLCRKNAPDGFNPEEFDSEFHLFTWFTNHSNPLLTSGYIDIDRQFSEDGTSGIRYFELNYYGTIPEPEGIRDNSTCGDGIRQAGEECDYTGVESGCNFMCLVDSNGVESDTDGDSYDCSAERLQPSMCWVEKCGDGVRSSNEQCDDGNDAHNDGCYNCRIEPLYHCSQEYNATSICSLTPTLPPPTVTPSPSTLAKRKNTTPNPSTSAFNIRQPFSLNSASSSTLRTSHWSVLLSALVVVCVTLLTQR